MYIVYTEVIEDTTNRYYYGTYEKARANEVAEALNRDCDSSIWHCVCPIDEAEEMGIQYLPKR